jgi:hypothetical protein
VADPSKHPWLTLALGLPVLFAGQAIGPFWRGVIRSLLPAHLSPSAADTVIGFSLIAILLAAWVAVLKLVDILFGTALFPYQANPLPRHLRAQLHRQGLVIVATLMGLDTATKALFGVPSAPGTDNSVIVMGIATATFVVAWWRAQSVLLSLGFSLIVASGACVACDWLLFRQPMALPVPFTTLTFSFGFLGGMIGVLVLVASYFVPLSVPKS